MYNPMSGRVSLVQNSELTQILHNLHSEPPPRALTRTETSIVFLAPPLARPAPRPGATFWLVSAAASQRPVNTLALSHFH